ncbi:hypothetical protein B0T09DRAFT_385427 [Sordaria sp. MPI-SDFR-AT-0083]|nr:hypothetical protein B0T09DRAFT_385427 [Sordaria sp. MPI-SDFR-AT-0083]
MTPNVTMRAQRSIKKKAKTARTELERSRHQYRVDNLEDIRNRASIKRHREMASREIQKAIEGGEAGR